MESAPLTLQALPDRAGCCSHTLTHTHEHQTLLLHSLGQGADPVGHTTFNASFEAVSFDVSERGKGGIAHLEIRTVSASGSMLSSFPGSQAVPIKITKFSV